MNEQRLGLTGNTGAPGLMTKILTFAVGAVLLLVALMFSALLFATALTVGLLIWGRLWWKTRELRKRMREQGSAGYASFGQVPPTSNGRVIEGEVIRDTRP